MMISSAQRNAEKGEVVIVDSHNEVLPYWFREYMKLKYPLVVVRIDKHHDMNHECPVLPAREGRQFFEYLEKITPYIFEYAKRKLNEGNFTCPAFHYGIIGALYHFNPREKGINAYGRVSGQRFINTPKTTKKYAMIGDNRIHRIVWDEALTKLRIQGGKVVPIPQKISVDDFRVDIEESCFPVVIGFDLDGLYGIGDKSLPQKIVDKRLEMVKQVLECISSPILACIARSQTPRAYVPPELVDVLQEKVLNLIEITYIGLRRPIL